MKHTLYVFPLPPRCLPWKHCCVGIPWLLLKEARGWPRMLRCCSVCVQQPVRDLVNPLLPHFINYILHQSGKKFFTLHLEGAESWRHTALVLEQQGICGPQRCPDERPSRPWTSYMPHTSHMIFAAATPSGQTRIQTIRWSLFIAGFFYLNGSSQNISWQPFIWAYLCTGHSSGIIIPQCTAPVVTTDLELNKWNMFYLHWWE